MVRVTEWRKNGMRGFEVDIRGRLPDGTRYRERVKSPVPTRTATLRWGQQREAVIIEQSLHPRRESAEEKVVPTWDEFWPRFVEGHIKANTLKPSYVSTVEMNNRLHVSPAFGKMRLDAITQESIQRFKGTLLDAGAARKTVNNIISLLSGVTRRAEEWGVIERRPTIKFLKFQKPEVEFLDFIDYDRLVQAARALDPRIEIMVLLGGDAGLRRGEIVGLEWADVDFTRGFLTVRRSDWDGHVTAPKGGRSRKVRMTVALHTALKAHRHLRGPRVLCHDDGTPVGRKGLHGWMGQATRRAGMGKSNALHVLRHTFCSHLAMRGAPAKAIQELAGHADLSTTLRYMHLSPAARDSAIRLLDTRPRETGRGDDGETGSPPSRNAVEH